MTPSVVPAPIQISPSGSFLGDDGSWSTFQLRVGTPAQDVDVLPSTLISEDWVIFPGGCTQSGFSNCGLLRGNLFENDSSTTWTPIGSELYSLAVEGNLVTIDEDGGYYAYDTVGLSTPSGAGIVLDHQVVAGIVSPTFWVGSFGLSSSTSDVDNQNQTSFLKTLQANNEIPSLSYAYTAGAWYRNATTASLTFGGQDLSRFVPNNINFTMDQDLDRDLTVGLQSITLEQGGKQSSLLTDGIFTFIDSTLPYIWLPNSSCAAFADAFNLEFQPLSLLYTVSSTAHAQNLKNNASLVFQLGNTVEGGESINITFPYSAFDLNYTNPTSDAASTISYFPIRQAADPTQYTLGRTFLQEAYLSVNYEFQNFSLAQAVPVVGSPDPHIVPLPSINDLKSSGTGGNNPSGSSGPSGPNSTGITIVQQSSGPNAGAIAGGVVGGLVAIALLAGILFCCRRRSKQRRAEEMKEPQQLPPELGQVEPPGGSYFAIPTKIEPSAYAHAKSPQSITSDSDAQEMPSPPVLYDGSTVAASVANGTGTRNKAAIELAASDVSHELHSRSGSIGIHSRMSEGPSPSLNPQAPGALAGTWAGTHYEPTSPVSATDVSVMSVANSQTVMAAGPAALVSHTRGRASPRTNSYQRSPPFSPAHSAAPSADYDSFQTHSNNTNNYSISHRPNVSDSSTTNAPMANYAEPSRGASFDTPSTAAAITTAAASLPVAGVGVDRARAPSPYTNRARAPSNASDGTLVNNGSRSASPEVGRHNAPYVSQSAAAAPAPAAIDDLSFVSPPLVSLGFPGIREQEREREREAALARQQEQQQQELPGSPPHDIEVEGGSLEYAYRAATTPEPLDAAELAARRAVTRKAVGR